MSDDTPILVRSPRGNDLRAVCGESRFGYLSYVTAALPDRIYVGLDEATRPASIQQNESALDITVLPTPMVALQRTATKEPTSIAPETRRTVPRLEALWLLAEDRYRLLDAYPIEPLAHQASLVDHILSRPELSRVLIADEVGLGKTVEAGLLIRRLRENATKPPRVLYLTEAQLVPNVVDELRRLGLKPRKWTAQVQEAKLDPDDSDTLVVASIHRASFSVKGGVDHLETVSKSGPWDVIIVDEAHHLSDWSLDGHSPGRRMDLIRKLARKRLVPDGRFLLMTGTPHQGHDARFRNLLKLLSEDDDLEEARGRIIYRIKEDITDWDGAPLFPARDVRAPTVVQMPPAYADWLDSVHRLLAPSGDSRAAGWRRAQALQWCSSSPQAGLAYLTRLALRAGWRASKERALADALAALRPYRGGTVNEPVSSLEDRMLKGMNELDEDDGDVFSGGPGLLRETLDRGADLVRQGAMDHKLAPLLEWLDASPDEKLVVFAQPIETVLFLHRAFRKRFGKQGAVHIVGGQDPDERAQLIERFTQDQETRVLVSSRSGGEGINLQVCRHLVHFDVPWNPMDMEQRVGRVHRFGSVRTVRVDTLVLEGSREQRVLDRCRARLGQIVRDLDPARFELLFARTMSLIPQEDLAVLMAGESFGPLTPADEDRLDQLVKSGFEQWQSADRSFRERMDDIRLLKRGETTDADFEAFIERSLGAKLLEGWKRRTLAEPENPDDADEPKVVERPARVFELPDGSVGYVGRDAGVGLVSPAGTPHRVTRLGLNVPAVAQAVRNCVGGGDPTGKGVEGFVPGHGSLLVPRGEWSALLASLPEAEPFQKGALALAILKREVDVQRPFPLEMATGLTVHLTPSDASMHVTLDATQAATIVRLARAERAKRTVPALSFDKLVALERQLVADARLGKPNEPVPVVIPIAALWMEPDE